MTVQSNFSNSVKVAYKQSKKTLAEFSDEIGISRTTLQDILSGNSNPRADTIEVVAEGLHTSPIALLSDSYAKEELSWLISLFKFSDIACRLCDDEKEELAMHCHAIIRILFGPDEDK